MKTRTAEQIVQKYIRDLPEPSIYLARSHFYQRSCTKWAAEEILRTIRKRDISPIRAVEEFVEKMEQYACHRSESSYIFSIAYDIGIDILDILLAAE